MYCQTDESKGGEETCRQVVGNVGSPLHERGDGACPGVVRVVF